VTWTPLEKVVNATSALRKALAEQNYLKILNGIKQATHAAESMRDELRQIGKSRGPSMQQARFQQVKPAIAALQSEVRLAAVAVKQSGKPEDVPLATWKPEPDDSPPDPERDLERLGLSTEELARQ